MLNTAAKVWIAGRIASTLIGLGVGSRRRIQRGGICLEVDLREGIDLSLFLFGSFQRHVTKLIQHLVPPDGVVIDVGANIGAVTLPVAAHLSGGRVFAFEPTDFAFEKLRRNLELNPSLASRVVPLQTFVGDRSAATSDLVAYSSWPVIGGEDNKHPVHKGIRKGSSCGQISIDDFVERENVERVSLIKIDTDGNEYAVLAGAARCLAEKRPLVIFEACAYLMVPPAATYDEYVSLFDTANYEICWGNRFAAMSPEQFRRTCPTGGGLDLIAVPREQLARRRS